MAPSREQMLAAYNEAGARVAEGQNTFPAMTYDAGVEAALGWALGETTDEPFDE